MILVFVETDASGPTEVSLEAVTFARTQRATASPTSAKTPERTPASIAAPLAGSVVRAGVLLLGCAVATALLVNLV